MKDSLCVMTSDYLTIKNNDLICCSEVQTKATWEKSQNECTSRKTTFANQYFHDVPALVLIRNISVSPFWNLSTRPCRWFVGVCNQKKSNCSLVIEIWFPELRHFASLLPDHRGAYLSTLYTGNRHEFKKHYWRCIPKATLLQEAKELFSYLDMILYHIQGRSWVWKQ